MIAARKRKTKDRTAAPPEANEYEAARARYTEIRGKRHDLESHLDGLRMALRLAANPSDVRRVPDALKSLAHPHLKLARKRPEKVAAMAADVEDDIDALMATFPDEHDRWQAAQRRETNRLAAQLQPRHRAAVKAMGAAMEELSKAIEAERTVRAELAQIAPLPTSPNLPDLSSDLQLGCLSDFDGRAAAWARRLRKMGL